ncbi:MAG: HipA domain-containing protein [Myxococcota bacterium]
MPRSLDWTQLEGALLQRLGRGAEAAPDLQRWLSISQPSLSRLVRRLSGRVLPFGKARNRRYALRRTARFGQGPIPVFEIGPDAQARQVLVIEPVEPEGYVVDGAGLTPQPFDDLPWFLQDLRPVGFLGRLVPRSLPPGWLPDDARLWSADQVLDYALRFGWNLPGAFVVGEEAVQLLDELGREPPHTVDAPNRADRYAEWAADVIGLGDAGSSAAGEQPKLLAHRREGSAVTPVLVKFSPPRDGRANQRIADLLVAEHLALETLREGGHAASRSTVIVGRERVFLEVERFDRTPEGGRRSTVTLQPVDAEFVGSNLSRWTACTSRLVSMGLLDATSHREVGLREQFGVWVGNTDQHFGNLTLFLDGLDLAGVAPAYDVNPAAYMPIRGEVREGHPSVRNARPSLAEVAGEALGLARAFWERVRTDGRISTAFQVVAEHWLSELGQLKEA